MHKGVILLVKAGDKKSALESIRTFMEPYGDGDVWDWYAIGGRWTNTLAPAEASKTWDEYAKSLLHKPDKHFISQQDIDTNQLQLQQKWTELGLLGNNPYCNHYALPSNGNAYDVVPLMDCIEKVKDWSYDPIERAKIEEAKAKLWTKPKTEGGYLDDNQAPNMSMYGYQLQCAAGIYGQTFNFDCNVFNTEDEDYTIPDNYNGWYAVMVDMHN